MLFQIIYQRDESVNKYEIIVHVESKKIHVKTQDIQKLEKRRPKTDI